MPAPKKPPPRFLTDLGVVPDTDLAEARRLLQLAQRSYHFPHRFQPACVQQGGALEICRCQVSSLKIRPHEAGGPQICR